MNVSFQGRLGTQGQRQRQPRITELPTDPTAKAPRKVRAAGTAKYTGKLGKRLLQLQSARQKATKNGLGCLVCLGGCASPSNKGAIPQTLMRMSLSRVEQYTACMWQLQSSIIPASLCPQRIQFLLCTLLINCISLLKPLQSVQSFRRLVQIMCQEVHGINYLATLKKGNLSILPSRNKVYKRLDFKNIGVKAVNKDSLRILPHCGKIHKIYILISTQTLSLPLNNVLLLDKESN